MSGILGRGSFSFTPVPEYVTVGNYSSIAQDVVFHDPDDQHLYKDNKECVYTTNWDQPRGRGETIIGNDVWIGRGAKLFSGITIGDGVVIGAWAVVTKSIPPYAVVIGNPPQITRYRFTPDERERLAKIAWWEWSEEKVTAARADMKNIEVFLQKYMENRE